MKLNKASPVPLYYQLVESLKEQIEAGQLKPGEQLPSERELSELATISRMTARQAVAYLVREGVLEVKPGIGTFVAAPKLTYDALHLLGFTEEALRQGGTAQSRVLTQELVPATPRVSAGLQLGPNELVVKIVRLRFVGDMPLLLETSFVPVALCPGLEKAELEVNSLYALLEAVYHIRLSYAQQTLEATIANDYEQFLFPIQPGAPMILLEGVTYSDTDQPIEYFKAVYRGDRFKFNLESHRGGTNVTRNGAISSWSASVSVPHVHELDTTQQS
ncbi:phosphonate metabolism transcriptional regulator PhnF [soil metagenome]